MISVLVQYALSKLCYDLGHLFMFLYMYETTLLFAFYFTVTGNIYCCYSWFGSYLVTSGICNEISCHAI